MDTRIRHRNGTVLQIGEDGSIVVFRPGKPLPYVIYSKSNEINDSVHHTVFALQRNAFGDQAFGVLNKLVLKVIEPFAGFVSMVRSKLH